MVGPTGDERDGDALVVEGALCALEGEAVVGGEEDDGVGGGA